MKSLRDESGQALIVVALGLLGLLGFVGLAVDVGTLMHNKRNIQVAADAAAVAGALARSTIGYAAAAKDAAAKNGFTDGSNGVTIGAPLTPAFGEYAGKAGYIEVTITKNEPTIFMGLFGHGTVPVTARAVAVAQSSSGAGTGCGYLLGATGADLSMTGNVDVEIPTCGLYIDSSSSNAMSVNGNVTLNAASVGIVGGLSKNGNVHLTPSNPTTGITPYSDPLSYLPGYTCTASSCTPTPSGSGPSVTCQAAQSSNGGTTTLSPGCYQGFSFGGNSTVILNPGTYIISGPPGGFSFSGNSNVSGNGVTIYIANGSLSMVGNTTLHLSAPTSGTFSGVLFDQSPSDTNAASLVGNSGSVLKGVMYFPTANFSLTGNSGTSIYTDFVVSSLTLVGNASFNDYASLGSTVTSPITVVTLVE